MVKNRSLDIKIKELEQAVTALKQNRDNLLKELQSVKTRTRAKQTV